jgi:hypothetical protein
MAMVGGTAASNWPASPLTLWGNRANDFRSLVPKLALMPRPLRRLAFALLIVTTCLLSSCASHLWRIQLRDGRNYQATSEPTLSTKTGYYRYRNTHGRDALLRADEVLQVEQVR